MLYLVQVLCTKHLMSSTCYGVLGTGYLLLYQVLGPTTLYQVPGAKHLVPSTWYHVPGTLHLIPCFQVLRARSLVPSSCYQGLGTKHLVPSAVLGARHLLPCTGHLIPSTWYQTLGTKHLILNNWIQAPGSASRP